MPAAKVEHDDARWLPAVGRQKDRTTVVGGKHRDDVAHAGRDPYLGYAHTLLQYDDALAVEHDGNRSVESHRNGCDPTRQGRDESP